MEKADHQGFSKARAGENAIIPSTSKPRTALILYGSETGNAQDVAEEVGRLASRLHFDTTVLDMDSTPLRDILRHTVVICAISTTGQGEMPQNARLFWKTLLSGALKPGLLKRVRFSSFGIGDSSYARYNTAHRMLHGRMVQLGAKPFCERGEGNEQHPEGHSAGFREWFIKLKESLLEAFPLESGVEPMADDEFLEPKWKLALAEDELQDQSNGHEPNGVSNGPPPARSMNPDEALPSRELLGIRGAHRATLTTNDRITPSDHFQDVRLLDLSLPSNLSYGPGAVAVIYPKNFPSDVQSFLDLMSWQPIADKPLTLIPTTPQSATHPSPLRYFDLQTHTLTLRWLLENVLDIMSIPRRTFFSLLLNFAHTTTEDDRYQRDRLLELADPSLIDELWDYTTRPKRTILEVMSDFTTIKIPYQYCLTTIPLMKGRQFSIASGGHLRSEDEARTRVQLLIAIANPPSPIIKYRRRYGVCTRYIATLEEGQELNIGLQPGYLDVRPEEMQVPVLMIGPGTGVAPMRSLIYQRLQWARELGLREKGKELVGDVLIFGCRNQTADYFFREEWEALQRDEGLTVLTAFSRDKDKSRQYVQDVIKQNGELVRRLLVEQKGKVYLCGSSGNMPKGVREALVEVLGGDGERYLEQMERQGRFKQETW